MTGLKPSATEILADRTEYSQTFDNHDGTKTTQFFVDPVFYRPAGADVLQPISVGFSAEGNSYVSTGSPVEVAVTDSAQGNFLTTKYNGESIGFRLPDGTTQASVEPEIDGSVADYTDLLPGVGLRVIANAHGAKSFFIWNAPPDDPTLSYVVDAPDLTLKSQVDGSIAILDGNGAMVAQIPVPYAVDSLADPLTGGGHTTNAVQLTLGPDGKTVTVSVDPEWLKAAIYPVYVDPSTGWVYNAGSDSYGDAFVDSHSGAGYDDYQDPTSPYYHELWNGTSPADGGVTYDFLRWNLGAYANVTVDSATFRLYPWHQYYNSPTTETTYVRRVTSSWTESGVAWANKPTYTTTNTATTGCVEGTLCNFDVSDIVQLWLQGISPSSNYGFQVDTIGKGDTYWKRFVSSEQGGTNRPALSITYHTPTSTAVYPTGGGPTSDTTVTWSYADSASAAQTKYHVDVATDSAFTSIVATSGDVSSAAESWPISTALSAGTTYYWRVKTYNGTSWSAFSATSSFIYSLGNLGLQQQFGLETFELGGGDQARVNVSTGNLVLSHGVVSLPIRGSSVGIGLTYNSQDPGSVSMGPGWRLSVHRRLTLNADGSVTLIDADGARYTFTSPVTVGTVTTYTRPPAFFGNLKKDTSQAVEFSLTYRDLSRDTYDILGSEGLLTRSEDRHANGFTVAYVSATNRITTITDTAGSRTIDFAYDGSNRVSSITDWAYVDGSGVVQTTATGTRRATRFFYDASGNLAGWADPLNTSGSCPTGGSHLTCLTYGTTLAISKTQTVEGTGATTLTTSTRTDTTQITFVGPQVVAVKDAEQVGSSGPATTFGRDLNEMVVVGPGTPSSTTTYGYLAATDTYGRIQSTWRLLGTTNIEHRTVFDSSYPTLQAADTDNFGALLSTPARTITTTYVANSLGLVARTVEPLTASPATNRQVDFTYDSNNDLVQRVVSQDGSGTLTTTTRYCYDASCTLTATGLDLVGQIDNYISAGPQNADTNVTTNYTYDTYGQRLTEIRHNRDGAGAVRDDRITAYSYDSLGDQTSVIVNYANGTVTSPGDDITPNSTTGARTDLTTALGYDTAGNQVSSADPRRAIEAAKGTSLGSDDFISRTTFDAVGDAIVRQLPTTPTSLGGVTCAPDPGCRRTTTTFDELGNGRAFAGYSQTSGVTPQTGTEYDRDGRATRLFEDTDGSSSSAPTVTGKVVYDVAGRNLDSYDRVQVGSASSGSTHSAYDSLGRVTDLTTAYGSSPSAASVTHSVYDALDQATVSVIGYLGPAPQTSTTTYDLGGRAVTINDGFTCQTSIYDYRDLTTSMTDGLDGTCVAVPSQTQTTATTLDKLGRIVRQEVVSGPGIGDRPMDDTLDSAGNRLSGTALSGGVSVTTAFSVNLLDQVTSEAVASGPVSKSNYDAAGNVTDRCTWAAAPTDPCKPAGSTFASPQPTQVTTAVYDALNTRIALSTGVGSAVTSTTTYDPANSYQISATYLPTGAGKEFQTLYGYDVRQRLSAVTEQLCTISSGHACSSTTAVASGVYAYDDNDNRSRVTESNGATSSDLYYCYDAANRLVYRNTAAPCSSSAKDETNLYNASGDRTQAVANGVTTYFAYSSAGQLCRVDVSSTTCSGPNVAYDAAGNTVSYGGWAYQYDSLERLVTACQAVTCAGSGFNRVDYGYDGEGNRVSIKETTAAGQVTTTSIVYQRGTVTSEAVSNGIVRTFVTDDAGRILKMTVSGDTNANDNASFVVAWSGHGDAMGLWRQNADGTLTLANSYSYSTWGASATAVVSPFGNLGFRYLYVGDQDVQSDNSFSMGLLYMHAREYAPSLGRFIQADSARDGANTYTYAASNPTTQIDPSGHAWYPWSQVEQNRCELVGFWNCTQNKAIGGWAWLTAYFSWEDPKRNSMRHCLWQCVLRNAQGYQSAYLWGWAHEFGSPDHYPYYDEKTDLRNNWVGRYLGQYLDRFWWLDHHQAALVLCQYAWQQGWLWADQGDRITWSDGRALTNPWWTWN